ncbi:MAG: epoxyqueuosine reductase QueH [Firmicutes bacterium]|nr:epoxyqueuosine reductase QueH [Bacillota bacterium]
MTDKKKLLLHSCCGPCSTSVLESLREEYETTVFFYNPNITDGEEYEKRLAAQKQVCREEESVAGVCPLVLGNYDPERYIEACAGLEDEPEGGSRCTVCFRLRLEETARKAKELGFEVFGTTLSVSPHKNYKLLSVLGQEIARAYGLEFLDRDFKKKNGYGRSVELSKAYGLYRQNYCGCDFAR